VYRQISGTDRESEVIVGCELSGLEPAPTCPRNLTGQKAIEITGQSYSGSKRKVQRKGSITLVAAKLIIDGAFYENYIKAL